MSKLFGALAISFTLCVAGCSRKNAPAASSNGETQPPVTIANAGTTAPSGSFTPATGSDKNAIRSAIENHLRTNQRINFDAMVMSLDSVSVNGDHAQARATFSPKGGGMGMAMMYYLQRSGAGWIITRDEPVDKKLENTPIPSSHSGTDSSQSTPTMPDVDAFFKNHPAPKDN